MHRNRSSSRRRTKYGAMQIGRFEKLKQEEQERACPAAGATMSEPDTLPIRFG